MPQLEMKPLPEQNEDESLIGDDGELSEADPSVDPKVYKEYIARFRELSRQPLNTWDDSRVMLVGFVGISIFVICIIALALGWEVIKFIAFIMIFLALAGLKGRRPF